MDFSFRNRSFFSVCLVFIKFIVIQYRIAHTHSAKVICSLLTQVQKFIFNINKFFWKICRRLSFDLLHIAVKPICNPVHIPRIIDPSNRAGYRSGRVAIPANRNDISDSIFKILRFQKRNNCLRDRSLARTIKSLTVSYRVQSEI